VKYTIPASVHHRPIHVWAPAQVDEEGHETPEIDTGAMEQLRDLSKLRFVHPHGIAVMPDVHQGFGSTVGSVIPTEGAIIPAAVGVDIGCGMMAARTDLRASELPESLANLRAAIERRVPLGPGGRRNVQGPALEAGITLLPKRSQQLTALLESMNIWPDDMARQMGTLGSGNHFIELCLDQEDMVWVMLHSGSRGVGNRIGTHFISVAKREMEKYGVRLPHQDLAFLPDGTWEQSNYIDAVSWAQDFASLNRQAMMSVVLGEMEHYMPRPFTITRQAINCHHNYVEKENHFGRNVWLTRKGAIRARTGDLGIIPGSMGAKSYIVRGLGNPDSYHSCSHGAGRRMSRGEARKRFSVEDLAKQTSGVECRKDDSVLDEAPGAYKDIDAVMAAQGDLVKVMFTLKQILNVKGA
jgi:tRNA-splicing ligase RtcB